MAVAPTGTEWPQNFQGAEFEALRRATALAAPADLREQTRRFVAAFDPRDRIYSATRKVWDRGTCLMLAENACTQCRGLGYKTEERARTVCACVYRACFRQCHEHLMLCRTWQSRGSSRISLEGGWFYSRKVEEYCADFDLIARQNLDGRAEERVYEEYLIGLTPWRACLARAGLDRGRFFHAVYRLRAVIGRAFHELEPYALHPVDLYFGRPLRARSTTELRVPSVVVEPDAALLERASAAATEALPKLLREPRPPLPSPGPDPIDSPHLRRLRERASRVKKILKGDVK